MIGLKAAFSTLALLASSSAFLSGCSGQAGVPEEAETQGEIALQLAVGPLKVNSARFKITGPRGSIKSGTIKLQTSTVLTAIIGGLPAAVGYTIDLSAVASNGTTTCSGSSRFDIVARQTTPVAVHLTCQQASQRGSVSVKGTLNICPVIDSVAASPEDMSVGDTTTLSVAAHDDDGAPEALLYQWTASAGAFEDSTVEQATFTCVTPGLITITVLASDGDPAPSCAAYGSVKVNCSEPAAN
jgi:hypothetical protein